MKPAGLRRLHPLTLVLQIPSLFLRWVGPFVLISLLFGDSSDDGLGETLRWAIIGTSLGTAAALTRYLSLRYGIQGDHMVIKTGLFDRRTRTIPLDQIQNIDLRSRPLQRLLGVTEVRIETAGGESAEASLQVVGVEVAERFRNELLNRRNGAAVGEEPPDEEVIRTLGLRALLLHGATENRIGLIFAALFGLDELLEEAGTNLGDTISDLLDRLIGSGPAATGLALTLLVMTLLVGGWLVSIIWTALTYHRYTLGRTGDGLRRRHGLLTRFEALIPTHRIQVLLLDANPLRRACGQVTLRVQSAGSPEKEDGGGSTMLFPLLPLAEAGDLAREIFPSLEIDLEGLRKVHPLAFRRGLIRYLTLFAAAAGPLTSFRLLPWLLALPVAILLAWLLAHLRYQALRYSVDDAYVFARTGVWTRRLWVIPRARIQTVKVVQSPFQRRYGLASVVIDTAGAASWGAATIIDLAEEEAREIFEDLASSTAVAGYAESV